MKRTLSLFLALVLFLGLVLPAGAEAADYPYMNSSVSNGKITWDAWSGAAYYVYYAHPDFENTVSYYSGRIETGADREVDMAYKLGLAKAPEGKYHYQIFAFDADGKRIAGTIGYSFTFKNTFKYASTATASVKTPVAGDRGATTATVTLDEGSCKVSQVLWSVKNSNGFYNGLSSAPLFKEGKIYRVEIRCTTSYGTFLEKSGLSATVNGKKATLKQFNGPEVLSVVYDFPTLTASTSSFSVTVTAPSVGKKPSTAASVPSGASYKLRDFTGGVYVKGVG